MSMTFSHALAPDAEFEHWRATWMPPSPRPLALPGYAILEFSPYGTRGAILTPEEASNNAMVVSDGYEGRPSREGYLPCGTEVIYVGTEGTAFTLQGRTFMRVPKAEIEMYIPKEEAA